MLVAERCPAGDVVVDKFVAQEEVAHAVTL
jgi:hypothetical protein